MSLLVYNITGAPVALAGFPGIVIPASPSPPNRGPARNVTSELQGLTGPQYTALAAQAPTPLQYEWTGDAEYPTGALAADIGGPAPGPHAVEHAGGGSDPLTVGSVAPSIQEEFIYYHETLINVEASATSKGSIDENASFDSPTGQPSHPVNLEVVFDAGWDGGDVTVSGIGRDGSSISEIFFSPGVGGGTVIGVKSFALIDAPGGIVNSAPGGTGAEAATVRTGLRVGIVGGASPGEPTFYKLSVDGVDEAFVATYPSQRQFTPTSAPDGMKDYEVWFKSSHIHTQSSHGHPLSS